MYNIYIIQNKITEKVYVGQSISVKIRFRSHKYLLNKNNHGNSYFQNAWNLYGSESFDFYILDSLETKEEMDEAEIFYIQWYKDLDLCYNLTEGGKSNIPTEETRLKLSLSAKNRPPISEESRQKMSLAKKNMSEETKFKMSESAKGRTISEEQKQKLREINLSKKVSEETKLKMSLAKRNMSDETKLKMSRGQKNRLPHSEKTKEKISKSHLGKKHSIESKLKMSIAQKNRHLF